METIKKGSRGEAVKTLQKALSLTVDGVFGDGTEKAVKEFQKKNGLTADGIVGAGTWSVILGHQTRTSSNKAVDERVIYMPISKNIVSKPGRSIRYLVIHYTAGASSLKGKARAEYNVFQNGGASADFAVDDEEMVQLNPDPSRYFCYAVGGQKWTGTGGGSLYQRASNANCISIEILSTLQEGWSRKYANHKGWSFTDAAIANARTLARILMKQYNIPLERVIRHYDVNGKTCPGIIGYNDAPIYSNEGKKTGEMNNSNMWEAFKKSL